jgi:hypothetical protein
MLVLDLQFLPFLFFSLHGFLYTAWDTSDWLATTDSATIYMPQVMYEQSDLVT